VKVAEGGCLIPHHWDFTLHGLQLRRIPGDLHVGAIRDGIDLDAVRIAPLGPANDATWFEHGQMPTDLSLRAREDINGPKYTIAQGHILVCSNDHVEQQG
jgi:hypothetical protein